MQHGVGGIVVLGMVACAATQPRPKPVWHTEESVMRQILKKADSLKACADQSKNQEPHVQGKLLVEFTISASGPVTDVVLPSEFVDTLLGRCVVESLKGITFPSAQGADVIYFPLVI